MRGGNSVMDGETGLDCVTVGQPDSVSLSAFVRHGVNGHRQIAQCHWLVNDSTVLKRIDKIRKKKKV